MYYCFYLLPFWFFYFKKMLLFTGEHPCWSVILIKFICKFIQIIHWQGCSPVFSSPVLFHIFRTPFYKNTSGGLRLNFRLIRLSLHEKCPNTKSFLVCIFLYSDQKKLRIWTQWNLFSSVKKILHENTHPTIPSKKNCFSLGIKISFYNKTSVFVKLQRWKVSFSSYLHKKFQTKWFYHGQVVT